MLAESFAFPTRGDDWLKTLLIGTLLAIGGAILVIPGIFLQGYLLRAIRAGAAGETRPPAFDDWTGLFVDGLKFIVVTFVWVGIPLTVFAVALPLVATFVLGFGTVAGVSPELLGGGTGLVIIGGMGLGFLLTLVLGYFLPAAVVGLATQDRIGAAFELGAIWRVASTKEYLVGVVVLGLVFTVLGTVAGLLTLLLVGFALQFYLQVASGHFVGQLVARAAPEPAPGRDRGATEATGSYA